MTVLELKPEVQDSLERMFAGIMRVVESQLKTSDQSKNALEKTNRTLVNANMKLENRIRTLEDEMSVNKSSLLGNHI